LPTIRCWLDWPGHCCLSSRVNDPRSRQAHQTCARRGCVSSPTCRRLMTVKGVGPLTALAFRATIDRPDRFRRIARCWRASRLDASALPVRPRPTCRGRISRCGDELARNRASMRRPTRWLIRSTKWSVLRAWSMNVAKTPGHGARNAWPLPASFAVIPAPRLEVTAQSSAGASRVVTQLEARQKSVEQPAAKRSGRSIAIVEDLLKK